MNRKKETFIYEGLGFPVEIIETPMKKMCGEWVIDINMHKLMFVVLEALIHEPCALTGEEMRFIRSFLEMNREEFARKFGATEAAVLKWEKGKNRITPSLEFCIRLYVSDCLKATDKEFRALYKELSLEQLSQRQKRKMYSIVVGATAKDLKVVRKG